MDAQIIAAAIVHRGDKIISQDGGLATLARGGVQVEEVPVIQTKFGDYIQWRKKTLKMRKCVGVAEISSVGQCPKYHCTGSY